jgi:hypothetical protein
MFIVGSITASRHQTALDTAYRKVQTIIDIKPDYLKHVITHSGIAMCNCLGCQANATCTFAIHYNITNVHNYITYHTDQHAASIANVHICCGLGMIFSIPAWANRFRYMTATLCLVLMVKWWIQMACNAKATIHGIANCYTRESVMARSQTLWFNACHWSSGTISSCTPW